MKICLVWGSLVNLIVAASETPNQGRDGPEIESTNQRDLAIKKLVDLFILLGVLARAVRYYLCFPLWDDECFLCVNFIKRSYAQLLQPLDYHQVAPILFLWIERMVVQLLGFSEYHLRLLPFVCSIAGLFFFRRVAERMLSGPALLFAIAVFSVSYPGIRYAAEAKPYGTDLFVSLVMLWLVVEWNCRRKVRFLVGLTILLPFALGVSYPAVFAAGGLSLVVGGVLSLQSGKKLEWIAWYVCNLSLVSSFLIFFFAVGRVQSGAEQEFMGDYWKMNFPPVDKPWTVAYWLLKTHASDFLAYPVGGPNWASTLTLLGCILGVWRWFQEKKTFYLGLVFCPAALHLVAASLQKYPYGGHVKFSQYLAPMICCLVGSGMAELLNWNSRWKWSNSYGIGWGCTICGLIGLGGMARDLANPYKTRSDFRARAFAQAFWPGVCSVEEVACLKSDCDLDFVPRQHVELSWSAHYLCNRAIEISRANLRPFDLSRVSTNRPVRYVLYRDARFELDHDQLEQWLDEMKAQYEMIAHESLPFARMDKNDRRLMTMEYVDSYKFVPREVMPLAAGPILEKPGTGDLRW